MITIKEVAQRAGVSPTTVSNVINGRLTNVSKKTYDKVQSILSNENYTPHMGAIMLAHSNSRIIGVITFKKPRASETVFEDPFTASLLGACEKSIYEAGYSMMLHSTQNLDELLKLVGTWKLDGLIIFWAPSSVCSDITKSTDTPVVFIDCYFDKDDKESNSINLDDKKGGYLMANYLISMGHTNIAYLGIFPDFSGGDTARVSGIKQAFIEHNMIFADSNCYSILDTQKNRELQYSKLYAQEQKTALFFTGDYYAWEALSYFRKENIDVSNDISIVGFDNNRFSKMTYPAITTIHQDIYQKGYAAVELVLKLIKHKKPAQNQIHLPVKLIIRDSVKKIN